MKKTIRAISHKVYKHIAKPVMFKLSPDFVHHSIVNTGKTVQKVAPIRGLMRYSWAHKKSPLLRQELCGIEFVNPVGLSAGFDANFELAPLLKNIGFGFMEGGSLTHLASKGNPKPWFYRLPNSKSLVVNKGLANQGVLAIIQRIKGYPSNTFHDFVLNISVAKTNSEVACTEEGATEDYIASLKAIKYAQVGSIVTLNISCPNAYGGEPFTTAEKLKKLLKRVDALKMQQKVFVKMPSDLPWVEFKKLLAVVAAHNVAGVTISNLAKDRTKAGLTDDLPATVKGNLSGKPTWNLSNELIKKTYQKYGSRFVITGVGGIFSAEDAYIKIKLGASLVELITGMIFEGPQLVGQINHGLEQLLKRDGYKNIGEAVGVDAKKAN
jgi:dihydroorotate dehydrogenase